MRSVVLNRGRRSDPPPLRPSRLQEGLDAIAVIGLLAIVVALEAVLLICGIVSFLLDRHTGAARALRRLPPARRRAAPRKAQQHPRISNEYPSRPGARGGDAARGR